MQGAAVSLRGIRKQFGSTPVLTSVDLEVEAGEFLTLLGPSGCGKSTLLRLIAGFEAQSAGSIEIAGRCVDDLGPKDRGLSMVFQNYALYPHMTVFENIAMPLVMRRLSFAQRFPGLGGLCPGARPLRREIDGKVRAVAGMLEIDALLARRPGQLSGGQRQRVALARAIVPEPSLFLMDEPLSNLDARLRLQMRHELTELHRKLGITFVYVTHDQVEAMTMSARVAVMMDGALLQVGTPSEIYARPVDLRVARFIGSHPINVFEARADSKGVPSLFGQPLPVALGPFAGVPVSVAIRPEDLLLGCPQTAGYEVPFFDARVARLEDHGSDLILHLQPEAAPSSSVTVRVEASQRDRIAGLGEGACRVVAPVERMLFFDPEGRRIEGVAGPVLPLAAVGVGA